MGSHRVRSRIVLLVLVLLVPLWVGCNPKSATPTSATPAEEEELASEPYVDPKGFFAIVPPKGWSVQEDPDDPRGKVAFNGPEMNLALRVLVQGVEFDQFEELVEGCRRVEERMGLDTGIEEITFQGRRAVQRSYTYQGVRFLSVDFIEGHVDHNIQYSARGDTFDQYLSLALKSRETYESMLRDVSPEEARKHDVAQKLRLAQLALEMNNRDLARQYVEAGLAIEPDNAELLTLQQKLQ